MWGEFVHYSHFLTSYKFKAKPLNQEIFNKSGLYGLKQRSSCDPPTVTVPHSPLLTTKQRGCRKRHNTVEEEIEQEPFKANPVPEKMFEKVLGMPEKKCAPITMPVTPAFLRSSKKRRIDQEESNEEVWFVIWICIEFFLLGTNYSYLVVQLVLVCMTLILHCLLVCNDIQNDVSTISICSFMYVIYSDMFLYIFYCSLLRRMLF